MSFTRGLRLGSLPRIVVFAGAMLVACAATPIAGVAQSIDESAVYYSITELNLRKGPGNTDAVFVVVPPGAELRRAEGEATNEYIPVTYNGTTGWVLELGLALPIQEVGAETAADPVQELDLYQQDTRVTLTPLMLRTAPDLESAAITGMPEGSLVTLTREGYENGYVTVDYGGARGWAYAELLAGLDEATETTG